MYMCLYIQYSFGVKRWLIIKSTNKYINIVHVHVCICTYVRTYCDTYYVCVRAYIYMYVYTY